MDRASFACERWPVSPAASLAPVIKEVFEAGPVNGGVRGPVNGGVMGGIDRRPTPGPFAAALDSDLILVSQPR